MCGRFAQTKTVKEIAEEFDISQILCELQPSYNIAPTHNVAAIINYDEKKLVTFKWGLIPHWAKDSAIGYKMINARAETIAEKPSYRYPFKKQRCLIIADGFYEWRKQVKTKIPFYLHLKSNKLFGFAGLYDVWTSPKGEKISTCTIITTEANELLQPIHHRMPVILTKENETVWLDSNLEDKQKLLPLLKPYISSKMEVYEVSNFVNSPKNNSPECVKPIGLRL